MNYSVKAKQLHRFVSDHPGLRLSELQRRFSYDMIARLVSTGCLMTVTMQERGAPKRVYVGSVTPPQSRKTDAQKHPRPRKRQVKDSIVGFLRLGEATLGEIATYLDRPSNNVSGTLLLMCSRGELVRRRVLGQVAGRTQSCEWYSYRLPE